MINWMLIFFSILSILIVPSCKKTEEPKEYSKTIVVLVDFSESAKNARQDYIEAFKKIIPKINVGDHFFVWKITEMSEMETKPLLDEDFLFPSPAANEFYRKQAMAKAQREKKETLREIEKKVITFLDSDEQLAKRTSILGSLQVAERVFKRDRRDKAVLVIMSDMIEDSSEYNFEREKLSEKRSSEIIANERSKKMLQNLSNLKVYVVGAKAPSREKYHAIQNFWLRYFKECGANLLKENYGSALLSFNE